MASFYVPANPLCEGDENFEIANREDAANVLQQLKEHMKDLNQLAIEIVREMRPGEARRAEAYWYAHIRCALDDEHGYLGGDMGTMQSTIDSMRPERCPECGELLDDDDCCPRCSQPGMDECAQCGDRAFHRGEGCAACRAHRRD
jgi:hypothetical protein